MKIENKITSYIDDLNKGKRPKVRDEDYKDQEYQKLTDTVRRLHSLRPVEYPKPQYQEKLIDSLAGTTDREKNKYSLRPLRKAVMLAAAVTAASVLLFLSFDKVINTENTSIVYAMEKAIQEVQAYHGILEVTETNELGETITQSKREVWADRKGNYYLKELEGFSKDIITVNNGENKWQINPEQKEVVLFRTFPDPYRFTFELGNELDSVKKATLVKQLGEELLNGRSAAKLEITPQGGATYYLWIDADTDLPLQKQTAMQNAIQYKVSYNSIEFLDQLPVKLMTYTLPEGYTEIDQNSEQLMATLEEAMELVDFNPMLAKSVPEGYTLDKISVDKNLSAVKLYYNHEELNKKVVVMQQKALDKLKPDSGAILGTVGENQAELLTTELNTSLRWQEKGIEYCVLGDGAIEDIITLAEGISEGEVVIPEMESEDNVEPQIPVTVDTDIEEEEQKSVDAGHSPWKLDPVFVTQVFASLLITPEGIVGDYPIAYESIEIIENNGVEAVAEINEDTSVAKFVYLKRLVRQDETGIWTVVGYDVVE